ncbi:hypothetical protein ABII15_12220 [Streptomyces sp. HUAS MG91]|uniref:DUF2029 domain-containing protein n=1 Tax=Streptomyces tabacisoli TaxID=3156398 RepID=A0AAU8IR73_9ACTN
MSSAARRGRRARQCGSSAGPWKTRSRRKERAISDTRTILSSPVARPSTGVGEPAARSPRRGRRFCRDHRIQLIATGFSVPLYVVWSTLLATGGGDLAAQVAWTDFVAAHPGSAYDFAWYGGIHVGNYSLVAPQLMALLGVRTVTSLAGVAATWFAAGLFRRGPFARPLGPALLAALTLWCDVASGRSTFALGVALALAGCSVAAGRASRAAVPGTAVLTGLATLASPVAGLFLLVAGATRLLVGEYAKAVALCAPPAVVVALTTVLFPFSGVQPMDTGDIWKPLVFCAALLALAPRAWRGVRLGSAVYALGLVLTALVDSPVGSNVIRLAELFAPPLLLAAAQARSLRPLRRVALAVVLAVSVQWVFQHTVHVVRMSTPTPAWAARTDGVLSALDRLGADRTRVEVVPALNHRETTALAPHVNTARGWNRQVDVDRGRLFYDGTFSPAAYRAWLDRWAVGLVVLPRGAPDWAAKEEAALVRAEPAWLKPVWSDREWRVYRVEAAKPLVRGPATVTGSDSAGVVVRFHRKGSALLRVAYSPWLRVGGGCLERAGEWTRLRAPRAGLYRVSAPYRLPWQDRC